MSAISSTLQTAHCRRAATQWQATAARRKASRRSRQTTARAGLLDAWWGSGGSPSALNTDAEGESLKLWLTERGLPPQALAAAVIPTSGRGLVAAQAISKGQSLLSIPQHLMVTPAAAQQQSCLRPLLESAQLPSWSVLALWLAEQRAAGSSGEWWPYVQLLPGPQQTGCVLEWGKEEVDWLRGSQLHEHALKLRAAAEASWAEMQPLLAAAHKDGLTPCSGAFTREALQWSFAMLLTRLVRLDQLGGLEALLPWADLLNHDCAATSFLDWSTAEKAVVLQAERRYRTGEQVYISYGQKTSGELLLSYGFCPEPGSNPHDGCRLRMCGLAAGSDGTAAREWKAAALAEHGYGPSHLFPLRMAAAPFEVMHYAALAAAAVGSQAEAQALARQLFVDGSIPPHLQAAALQSLVSTCKAAMAAYPRSFDSDRAELDQLQDAAAAGTAAGAGNKRRRQVLQVLVYERQVLSRTVFVLQQELRDVQRLSQRVG